MSYVEPRALLLRLLAERGAPEEAPMPDALVAAVRGIGLPAFIALAFAAVAQLLRARQPRAARALLQELDELAATTATFAEGSFLPSLVRVALALDERLLAERLAAAVQPVAVPRTRARRDPGPARRGGRRSCRGRVDVHRSGRPLANVRQRARALMPSSARAAAWSRSATGPPKRRSSKPATCSRRWATPALAETEASRGDGRKDGVGLRRLATCRSNLRDEALASHTRAHGARRGGNAAARRALLAAGVPVVNFASGGLAVLVALRYLPGDPTGDSDDYVLGWTEVDAIPRARPGRARRAGEPRFRHPLAGAPLLARRRALEGPARGGRGADEPCFGAVPPLVTRPFSFAECLHTPPMSARYKSDSSMSSCTEGRSSQPRRTFSV